MAKHARGTVTLLVRGPLARSDLAGLYERVCKLLRGSGSAVTVYCELQDVGADAVTVDALARLQLAARRHGSRLRLRNASQELLGLLALMGLQDVLPDGPMSIVPTGRLNSKHCKPDHQETSDYD